MPSGLADWKADSPRALARPFRSRLGGDGMGSMTGRDKFRLAEVGVPYGLCREGGLSHRRKASKVVTENMLGGWLSSRLWWREMG